MRITCVASILTCGLLCVGDLVGIAGSSEIRVTVKVAKAAARRRPDIFLDAHSAAPDKTIDAQIGQPSTGS